VTVTPRQPTATPIPQAQIEQTTKNERCTSSIGLLISGTCVAWGWLVALLVILLLIIFILAFGWPWYKVNKLNPPPSGYLMAYKDGVPLTDVIAIQQIAHKKRRSSLNIGGPGQGAEIVINGLFKIEFSVEWNGNVMYLREPDELEAFAYFKETPQTIRTGDPKITLKICVLEEPLKQ
jgi:hypothetical protein